MTQSRTRWLTLATMCCGLFLTMLDTTVVNLGLPKIQEDLGTGLSGLQWVVDGYTLMFAALLLPGGTAADRFGRRRIFRTGIVVFTVASIVCALAPDLPVLVAGRLLQGAGAAAVTPATLAIITAAFSDPRERATAIGIWSGVSGIALTAGPLVGGWLVQDYGWRPMFWINVPIGVLALAASARVVGESRDPRPGRLDVPGLLLGVAWVGALTYGLIEGPTLGWTAPLPLASFAVAAVALAGFVLVERRGDDPMVPLTLFTNRTITGACVAVFAVAFGVFGMLFFLSLFLQQVQGYSALAAGLRSMPATVATAVVATIAGALSDRVGSRVLIALGLFGCAAGLFAFTTVHADTPFTAYWWIELPLGAGLGLTFAPTSTAVLNAVAPARAGRASAITNAARQLGTVLGIAVIGAVVTGRFGTLLTGRLAELGVAPDVRARVADGLAAQGAGAAFDGRVPGLGSHAMSTALGDSFVGGLHAGMTVGALAAVLGGIVALICIAPPSDEPSRIPGRENPAPDHYSHLP